MKCVRFWLFPTAALLLVLTPVFAKDKSKSALNRNITHAQFVMLTTLHGNNFETAKVPPEDIKAFWATEAALKKWGRYTLVYTPDQADLIVVVRAGRVASVHGEIPGTDTISIGRMPRTDPSDPTGAPVPPIGSESAGAEVGPSEDMLEIYDAHLGVMASSPLWRKLQASGLTGPEPPLIKELRKEVEAAEKEDADKKKKP